LIELVFIDTSSRYVRDASAPIPLSAKRRGHLKSEKTVSIVQAGWGIAGIEFESIVLAR
jgi:hypothetical protein